MKRLAVLVALSLWGCSWAQFTTKDWVLRGATADEVLTAIDRGTFNLPEGLSMKISSPKGRPTLSFSGEAKAVDAAIRAIAELDTECKQYLVDVQFPSTGAKAVIRPVLRLSTGRSGIIKRTDDKTGNRLEFRVSPSESKSGESRVRLSMRFAGSGPWLVVPFLLGEVEEVAVVKGDRIIEITATNTKTKTTRRARLTDDFAGWVGLRFEVRAVRVVELEDLVVHDVRSQSTSDRVGIGST